MVVRRVLAWETASALALLALREKIVGGGKSEQKSETANGSAEESRGNAQENKGKQKGEKKKRGGQEIVLGKGTAAVRQVIGQVIHRRIQGESTPEKWAEILDSYFDPKDLELQTLLDCMKTILESNETRRLPKIPKGTRDFRPEQMAIRERAFSIIAGVFKRHGAVALDTPVFELRETLMGKYGEDSKLIYDLADQGGEICSLRYDLTVPFARYLAMYNISSLKRYHIARVYRRDNPSKGRYREFYQCDFDIAGQYPSMVPDFEVIKVLTELLDELDIGDYEVKLNHRKLLDGMLEICGVPQEKFRTICSAIDKLDKQPWEQVRKEMVEEKGLTPETADSIGSLVLKKGRPLEMLAELKQKDSCFLKHEGSVLALQELETLFSYLGYSDCLNKITFDLSLARGLDYYTGVIYEAVFKGTTQVGSIAAGGRYDNLVGMFSGKQVPAVGVSLGIERVFTIMEQQEQDRKKVIRATQTQVLAVVLGDDMGVAVKLVSELWAGKLKAEFALTSSRKIGKQIQNALESGIPYMLIMGENELNRGLVILKDIEANKQEEVPRDNIVDELKNRLNASNPSDVYTTVQ
uniref:Histidine--tRNA ligase, cytoplasmic n=1 Tax=Wollemia nobilis TaxID=56998 RepID=A0A0C9QXR6_9CONI